MSGFTRHNLTQVEFVTNHMASKREIEGFNAEVSVYTDYILDALVFQLRTSLAAQPLEHYEVTTYDSWWEHAKAALAPEWFKVKWPVKSTLHVFDAKAIWSGFKPPPGTDKYGPFLSCVTYNLDKGELNG